MLSNGDKPDHIEHREDFREMFKPLAEESGQFTVEISYDRESFCDLSGFDAVVLYISRGKLTPEQENGLMDFVRGGEGLLAVHTSNVQLAKYKGYIEMIGSDFKGHGPLENFDVDVVDDADGIMPGLNKRFQVMDEFYNLKICTNAPLRPFYMERKIPKGNCWAT